MKAFKPGVLVRFLGEGAARTLRLTHLRVINTGKYEFVDEAKIGIYLYSLPKGWQICESYNHNCAVLFDETIFEVYSKCLEVI